MSTVNLVAFSAFPEGRRAQLDFIPADAAAFKQAAKQAKWERLLVATAASYVVSPSAMGPVAVDPNREIDRLSASYASYTGFVSPAMTS